MVGKIDVVAISGGFDPLHVGHVRYIREAARHGRVHVYLNTDEWLIRKKGFSFMPLKERAEIVGAIQGVELVIPAMDDDDTVCKNIKMFKPDIFANGGDRGPENTPELKLCNDLRIKTIFGVGGKKIQSSSDLVKKVKNA